MPGKQRKHVAVVALTTFVAWVLILVTSASSQFVVVSTVPGATTVEVLADGPHTRVSFGIFRRGGLLDLHEDLVWSLCRTLGALAVATSSCCILLVMALLCRGSSLVLWQTLSVMAAGSSALGVPVFVLLQTRPCTDFVLQQGCSLGVGAYFWGVGTVLCVVVAALTQFLDPPPDGFKPFLMKGWLASKKPDSNVGPCFGPRRWMPLNDSDHESTAVGWGADEEENLIADKTDVEQVEDDVEAGEQQPQDHVDSPEPVTVTDKTALLVDLESPCTDDSREFVLSGPAVVYEDLEQEAPSLIELETVDSSVANDEEQEKPTSYSPDHMEELPALVDTMSGESSSKLASSDDQDGRITDLGSLEPSSEEEERITGDESILDRSSVTSAEKLASETQSLADDQPLLVSSPSQEQAPPSKQQAEAVVDDSPRIRLSEAVKKVVPIPVVDLSRSIFPKRRQRRRKLRGYHLMDDSNLSSSLPISPPLEIVTMSMINDAGLDDDLGEEDPLEEEFVDIWDDMERMVSPPLKYTTTNDRPIVKAVEPSTPSPSKPVARNKVRKRSRSKKKRSRSKRHGSPNSLSSSSGSLLSYTIPEESESDLDDSDDDDQSTQPEAETFDPYGNPPVDPFPLAKSLSAPNLALFDQPIKVKAPGLVVENVEMTGVNNVKKSAEIFSSSDSATRGSRGKQNGETSPRSVTHFDEGQTIVSMPESPAKSLPLFRAEREMRGGIHSASGANSESSSEGGGMHELHDLRSLPTFRTIQSQNARVARIRRLQQTTPSCSPIRCKPTYPVPCVSPDNEDYQPRRSSSSRSRASSISTAGRSGSKAKNHTPHDLPPRPPTLNLSAHSRSSGDHSYDSGTTLDKLNAELAVLLRPDGFDEGPSESSL